MISRVPQFVLIAAILCASLVASANSVDDTLLEIGQPTKIVLKDSSPAEFKVVTYNIRYRAGEDLRKLIEALRDDKTIGGAAIIGLQEVDRNRLRTGRTNTAKLISEGLGMNYAWAAPPPPPGAKNKQSEEETGVAILSPFEMTDVTRIVLPNPGPGGRRRAAIGATIKLGKYTIRVYSLHAETRIADEKKMEQYKAVLNDLRENHSKIELAIVLGDFNTISGDSVAGNTKLFTESNFWSPFPSYLPTWKTLIIELKLDWMWLRDLQVDKFGVDHSKGFSDHWPLWAIVKPKNKK